MHATTTVHDLPRLPPRPPDAHKGTFGRVLVLAGSRGMAGAAVLCGSAALRGGAGLVRVAAPGTTLATVAAGNPCYITEPLPEDEHGRLSADATPLVLELARASDVLAIGPGLGGAPSLPELLGAVLRQSDTPAVLDADGLNAFVGRTEKLRRPAGALVLTPHPGEFARLLGTDTAAIQARRTELAVEFAAAHGAVVVLKGRATVVTDGERVYYNATGNPGMATAGSGDVLTGLIAALLGQGLEAFAAAQLGTYLHGLAGDLARDAVGEISLNATDLLHYLPAAFVKHQSG